MSELYIGVMSGTSMDGIDIALCQINKKKCQLVACDEYNFDKDLKKELLHYINSKVLLKQLGEIDIKLGDMFAKSILSFMSKYKLKPSQIKAIALHGQTLWHEPNSKYPFSMQLGSAHRIHAKTSIKIISDFRNADMALGGEGAPLAPAFHKFVFSNFTKKTAVVNIGGISNITILDKKLKGWDCGPGNVLMDLWIQKTLKKPFDKKGKFANSGKVLKEMLEFMLNDNYFYKEAPKSTGREKFNKKYISGILSEFQKARPQDVQRTFLELTARVIAKDAKENKIENLIVCGGGSKNKTLIKRLSKLTKANVTTSDEHGINSDFLEAMAFAWMGYKRLHNEAVKISSVTGASKDTLLGVIYE